MSGRFFTECSPCGKFFTSTNTFDMHRVGEHWPVCTRRCLEDHEMEAMGMVERNGRWGMPVSAAKRVALEALHSRPVQGKTYAL